MPKHDVHTIEGDGFVARVHYDDFTWHAKIRLEDDGIRGKNLVLHADSAQELADRLGALSSAFVSTMNKVVELGQEPVQPEEPSA